MDSSQTSLPQSEESNSEEQGTLCQWRSYHCKSAKAVRYSEWVIAIDSSYGQPGSSECELLEISMVSPMVRYMLQSTLDEDVFVAKHKTEHFGRC